MLCGCLPMGGGDRRSVTTRTAAPKPRPKSAATGKGRPKSGVKDPENLYANGLVVTSAKKGKLAPEPSPRRGRRGRGDDGEDEDENETEEEEDPNSNAILRPRTAGGSIIASGPPPAAASPPSALRNRAPGAAGSATGPSGPGPSRLGVSSGPSSSMAGGGPGAARPAVAFGAGPPEARPAPPVRLDEPLPPAPASSGPSAATLIEAKRKEAEETKDAATRLRELQERNRLKSAGGMGMGLGLGATTPPAGGMGMGMGGGGWPAQPYPHQQPQHHHFPHEVSGLAGAGSSGGHGEASFSAGKPRLAPLGGPGSGASAAGHQAAAAAAAASLGLSNSKKNLTWLVESPVQSRQGSVTAPHAAAVGIPGSLPSVSQQNLNVHASAADGAGHHGQSRFAQPQQPASSTAYPMPRYSTGQLEAKLLAAAASPPRNPGGNGGGEGSAVGPAAGTAGSAAHGAGGSAAHSASGEQAVFAFASHIPLPGARPGNRAGGGAASNLAPIDGHHHPHHHSTPGTLGSSLGSPAHASHGAAGYSSNSPTAGAGANFDGGAAAGGRTLQHQSSSGKGSFGRGGMQAPPQGLNLAAVSSYDSGGARASPKAGGGGGGVGFGLASESANGPRTSGTGGFGLAAEAYGARPVTPAEQRKEAAAANEAMLSSLLGGGGGGVSFSSVKAHGVSAGAELERFDRVTEAMGRLDDLLAAPPPSSAMRPRTALKSENPAADFPGSAAPGMGAGVSAW